MNKMDEEKLTRVLPLMFKEVKIPTLAKETLRRRMFGSEELTYDDLKLVSAAGNLAEQKWQSQKNQKNQKNQEE